MKIKLLFMILTMVCVFPVIARAEGFVINLYYNAKDQSLTFDKFATQKIQRDANVDVSIVEFAQDRTVGPYVLKLYDINGEEISVSEFEKKEGAFQVIIPYFSVAAKISIFEKSTQKELLTADTTEMMTCNGNGICEKERGETKQTCLEDCLSQKQELNNAPVESFYGDATIQSDVQQPMNESSQESKTFWQKIIDFFSDLWDSLWI